MRTDTRTIRLNAPREQAFEFLGNPQNLPLWAVAFAHSVWPDGDDWRVQTAQGDIGLRMSVDAAQGTIDFHMSPAPGVWLTAYSRVVPAGEGSEYIFTQIQSAGMPDAAFEGQVTALREELEILQRIMKARAVCPN